MAERLILIGPTAPPVGGVSAHVDRMAFYLKKARAEFSVVSTTAVERSEGVFAIGNRKVLGIFRFGRQVRGACVIVHSSDLFGACVGFFFRLHGGDVAQFIHNGRSVSNNGLWGFRRFVWRFLLNKLNRVYVVNDQVECRLKSLGVSPSKIKVLNPYLPPTDNERLSIELASLQRLAAGRRVIAWCGLAVGERREIYGLDFFLDTVLRLPDIPEGVFVVIAMGEVDDVSCLDPRSKRLISELRESVYIVPRGVPFVSLLSAVDVLVRPTTSDGDSVSVREAISLGVPVVASDVVQRPPGCLSFPLFDGDTCGERVLQALRSKSGRPWSQSETVDFSEIAPLPLEDGFVFFERLVSVLQK